MKEYSTGQFQFWRASGLTHFAFVAAGTCAIFKTAFQKF